MENNKNDPKYSQKVHRYDDIEEHDHSLPRWWLGILYATIAFSGAYFFYYYAGPGMPHLINFEKEMHALDVKQRLAAQAGGGSNVDIASEVKSASRQKAGAAVFASKCISCHGPAGGGGIGPNLTDKYWIHGGKPENFYKIIREGVGDKGMPPWGPILSADELLDVSAFIFSIKNTNVSGGKAPQGDPET